MRQLIKRWIHSPVNAGQPYCAKYAREWIMPLTAGDGTALVLCEMDPGSLARARADSLIQVMGSLHGEDPVPSTLMSSYAGPLAALVTSLPIGATNPPIRKVLAALAAHHLSFEPDI